MSTLRTLSCCPQQDARKGYTAVVVRVSPCGRADFRSSYHSVRIDAVHYCELEAELAERRKHRSFFERNADSRDAPRQRLSLFCRTVRAREDLARRVLSLKVAYMTREAARADMARTVSVLANLRYVDLPEGFYGDDVSCATLRNELLARCPNIRRMKYAAGSEQGFASLVSDRHWASLEAVEMSGVNLDPVTLAHVLGSLPLLHDLRLARLRWLDDSVFDVVIPPSPAPAFPPLSRLALEDTPSLTTEGLVRYLGRPEAGGMLSSLSLMNTGILPSTLHAVLARAPRLEELSIVEAVSKSFPVATSAATQVRAAGEAAPTTLLASRSLVSLHYEITSTSSGSVATSVSTPHGIPSLMPQRQQPASSYYTYLARSLHANALPSLQALYVRDADFPEMLVLEPPRPAFASKVLGHAAGGAGGGFRQQLAVYSKGLDELEWNFTRVSPPTGPGRRGSYTAQRPISAYKLAEAGYAIADLKLGGAAGAAGGYIVGSGPKSATFPSSSSGTFLGPSSGGLAVGGERNSMLPPPRWSMGVDARRSIVVGNGFGGFLAVPANEFGGGGGRPGTAGGSYGGDGMTADGRGASFDAGARNFGADARPGSSSSWKRSSGSSFLGFGRAGHKKGGSSASRHDLWR